MRADETQFMGTGARMGDYKRPHDTVERLHAVVQDWGREVTDAQQRLEGQIRAAAAELAQIEGLLARKLQGANGIELAREVEELKRENQELRKLLAQREARIQELIERLSASA